MHINKALHLYNVPGGERSPPGWALCFPLSMDATTTSGSRCYTSSRGGGFGAIVASVCVVRTSGVGVGVVTIVCVRVVSGAGYIRSTTSSSLRVVS